MSALVIKRVALIDRDPQSSLSAASVPGRSEERLGRLIRPPG